MAHSEASQHSRYICDGHEYRTTFHTDALEYDTVTVKNNYGTEVAKLLRSPVQECWALTITSLDGEIVERIHEDDVIDNLIDQTAIQMYVSWAMDNETVEGHFEKHTS